MGPRVSPAASDFTTPSRPGSRSRHCVELLVALLITVLLVRTWLVEGLLRPLVVSSSSMAPGLAGPHREVVCRECQYRFVCSGQAGGPGCRAVCPNCGFAENDLAALAKLPGDRVLVDRSAYLLHGPRRWEVVVLRDPEQPSQQSIKRVVGLPGESIRIEGGEVYADGRIQRKPLCRQRAVAVLVYDAEHPPASRTLLPVRWQADDASTAWRQAAGCFSHPVTRDPDVIDWLTYRHWRRKPGAPHETEPVSVSDDCPYNLSQPRRVEDVHPVTDLLLSFRVTALSGGGRLWLRATDGREEFRVSLDPAGRHCVLLRGGRTIGENKWTLPVLEGAVLEFSLFDQQVLLAVDGQVAVQYPYVPRKGAIEPSDRPMAIGCEALGVQLAEVRLYRDVYYTHPIGPDGRWGLDRPVQLGPEEYFVLGDNSPVSRDSRAWPSGPGVGTKWLVGKAFVAYPPAGWLTLLGWQSHVSDPTRMRYIR